MAVKKFVKESDKRSGELPYQMWVSHSRPTKISARYGAELMYSWT